ncbi:hypothetical protein C8F04DRAFT_1173329 [Mycena alexandri]|uniref:Uncharacterized protein n=1 Tax=Mycena alexandri TaxID=1745969 RepID=A0AAD6XDW2_9AGAR|nr:hypothetical protein C8F04DRAFT_1173329 [Mycena alexandri]
MASHIGGVQQSTAASTGSLVQRGTKDNLSASVLYLDRGAVLQCKQGCNKFTNLVSYQICQEMMVRDNFEPVRSRTGYPARVRMRPGYSASSLLDRQIYRSPNGPKPTCERERENRLTAPASLK